MPTLDIGGKQVQVGQEFLQLSPEEQQNTVNDIARQIGVSAPGQGRVAPITEGQVQYEADKALLAKERSVSPETAKITDPAKAFAYSAANTALLNLPSHVAAAGEYLSSDRPWGWGEYTKQYEKQKEYEKALERQNPKASTAGTVAGIVGGLAVPGSFLARPAQAAKAAAAAKYGAGTGKVAEVTAAGGVGAGLSGASSLIETLDPLSMKTLTDAGWGFGLGAGVQAALPALGKMFTSLPKKVDEAGNLTLTDNGRKVLQDTFGGRLSPEDLSTLERQAAEIFAKKGETADAARETLLRSVSGEAPSRSMVTGERPTAAAQDVANLAREKTADALGAEAKRLAGEAPERTAIAEAIPERLLKKEKKTQAQYESSKELPGEFPPSHVGPAGPLLEPKPTIIREFMPNIQQALQSKGIPTTLESTKGYAKAEQAMNYLQDGLLAGNYPFGGKLDAKNIEAINQDLNRFWLAARADPQDQRAIKTIKNAFQQTITDNIINPAMFTGDGKKVVEELKKSRSMWKDLQDTFYSPKGSGASEFNRMMDSLVDQSAGRILKSPTQGALDTAQNVINQSLMSPKAGSAFYERLERALGKKSENMDAVRQQIRSLALDTGGDISKLPGKIDEFLKNSATLAPKVFSGQNGAPTLGEVKRLAEAVRIINKNPNLSNQQKENLALRGLSKMGSLGAGVLASQVKGPVAGAAVYTGSEAAKAAGRGILGIQQRAIEASGAPKYKPVPKSIEGRSIIPSAEPLESRKEKAGYGPAKMLPPLTINRAPLARASGGRVAAKLVSEVERAKKSVNNSTKALLNADDSHVARALEIANQNLEG